MLKESFSITKEYTIKQLMKERNITQKQLAKKLCISEQWINYLVNQNIKLLTINDLSNILYHLGYNLSLNITNL